MMLEFKVDGQSLSRLDLSTVAAGALNFITCRFDVSPEWFTVTPYIVLKAVFERDGKAYGVLLDDEHGCRVPHEVLADDGVFHVSLVGVCADEEGTPYRATANRVAIPVERSGPSETENSSVPTPDELEQIEEKLAELGTRITCLSSYNAAQELCRVEGAEYYFIWTAPNAEIGGPGGTILRTGGVYSIARQGYSYTITLTADLKGKDGKDGADGADGEQGEPGEKGEKGDRGEPGQALKFIGSDELESWCAGLNSTAYCLAREDIEYSFAYGSQILEGRMAAGDVYSFSPDEGTLTYHFSIRGEPDAETVTVLSDNLFDKTTVLGAGVFYYGSGGYELTGEGGYSRYAFVPLRGAGTYRTKFNWAEHESTGGRIALTDADNVWLMNVTGNVTQTDDASAYDLEFTVTEDMIDQGAAKIAFDCYVLNLDTVMIIKDRDYPDSYLPYGYIERATVNAKKVNNPLTEKTAVFLGDSICAGNTTLADAPEYGYGWGGLIGEANLMTWLNCGADGGTVTALADVQEHRYLTSQVDAAYAAYPDADYVIFEGGCNDADRMGDALLGEIAPDYETFDTATFSGAFEALVSKILNTYPAAKIGYVIPPKMYATADHTAKGHVHRRFFDRAAEICAKWGVPVVDLWNGCPLNPKLAVYFDPELTADEANEQGRYYTDGQHLTLTGYRFIAPVIEAWMRDLYVTSAKGGSGGSSTEVVALTADIEGNFVCNKTYAEISEAVKAGKQYVCEVATNQPIFGVYQKMVLPLTTCYEMGDEKMLIFSVVMVQDIGQIQLLRVVITADDVLSFDGAMLATI